MTGVTDTATPLSVRFRLLDPDMPRPQRKHETDGGTDLRTRVDVTLAPGEYRTVPTGIAVDIPAGYAGWLTPRSGLAAKHGISIVNAPGLIDAGYHGEVGVVLINLGSAPVTFSRGDRIAQLSVAPVLLGDWELVDDFDTVTARGAGGFGSSGRA